MKTANNYVYLLDGRAYINLTNRCHNACTFCVRNTGDGVAGTPLWLKNEPDADEVMSAFSAVEDKLASREVVFCGYGEPTERADTLVECASRLKKMGYSLRLNTNGLGNKTNGENIAPRLKMFDTVSVSLNNGTPEKYASVTQSQYGAEAFGAVLEFAAACRDEGINVVFTVVDVIGEEDIEKCKEICDKLGVPLRVREYVADNYAGSEER